MHQVEGWIREHGRKCLAIAEAVLGDRDEAEDVVQQVWIIAIEKLHRRASAAPIGAWLARVTLNLARSARAKRKRRAGLLERWLSASEARVAHPDPGDAHLRHRLWTAISGLPSRQQEVVILRLMEGMSTSEAADALHVSEGTIKASLHRACKKLRKEFRTEWDLARGGSPAQEPGKEEGL